MYLCMPHSSKTTGIWKLMSHRRLKTSVWLFRLKQKENHNLACSTGVWLLNLLKCSFYIATLRSAEIFGSRTHRGQRSNLLVSQHLSVYLRKKIPNLLCSLGLGISRFRIRLITSLLFESKVRVHINQWFNFYYLYFSLNIWNKVKISKQTCSSGLGLSISHICVLTSLPGWEYRGQMPNVRISKYIGEYSR